MPPLPISLIIFNPGICKSGIESVGPVQRDEDDVVVDLADGDGLELGKCGQGGSSGHGVSSAPAPESPKPNQRALAPPSIVSVVPLM